MLYSKITSRMAEGDQARSGTREDVADTDILQEMAVPIFDEVSLFLADLVKSLGACLYRVLLLEKRVGYDYNNIFSTIIRH